MRILLLIGVVLGFSIESSHAAGWQAGVSRTVITPREPMWLSGYGGRNKPSEGKVHDLYARCAVLQTPEGGRLVFVSLDLIGVPVTMADLISQQLQERYQVPRANIMFASSHTHCGPALDDRVSHMLAMNDEDWAKVKANQRWLNKQVLTGIVNAINDLKPAVLSYGIGKTTFAVNRRPPIGEGPVDHQVPVLKISSANGKTLRGVIFGYACHNTTMGFYQWFGDYAGLAQLYLEDRHADTVAMFFSGCGADSNPLPRRKMELAEKYGRMLALAVDEVMDSETKIIPTTVETRFTTIPLKFASVGTKEMWQQQLETGNRYQKNRARNLLDEIEAKGQIADSYDYPLQVWQFGNTLTWVAMGGEVVVDYSLRLKKELGNEALFVTAYANDVMGYIPSERVLKEGGYEGDSSMLYYQLPSPWKPGLEEQIMSTIHKLVRETKRQSQPE